MLGMAANRAAPWTIGRLDSAKMITQKSMQPTRCTMPRYRFLPLLIVPLLAACAAAEPGYNPGSFKEKKTGYVKQTGGGHQQDGTYVLSDQEQKLGCKQLSGSIQIRIEQMRVHASRPRPSEVSSAMQKTARPFIHGSERGVEPDADYARDKAQIIAYNEALKEKKCKSFDIEAELNAPPQRGAPSARPR